MDFASLNKYLRFMKVIPSILINKDICFYAKESAFRMGKIWQSVEFLVTALMVKVWINTIQSQ